MSFIRFKVPNLTNKSKQQLINFQRRCIQEEFNKYYKHSCKLEKEIEPIFKELETKLDINDFLKIKKFLYDMAKSEQLLSTTIHKRKLEKLNCGPIGQQYEKMGAKLVHNHSSHQLTPS